MKIFVRILIILTVVLVGGYLSIKYLFKDKVAAFAVKQLSEQYVNLLKSAQEYTQDTVPFEFEYSVSEAMSQDIRAYFSLDSLLAGDFDTWAKALRLARLSTQVNHDNPMPWPEKKNAIDLWEWSKHNPSGYNCRMHAIMLHELLLAEGIINRVVTCMPADSTDHDCHVVNVVWLPEKDKWAMIDSDFGAYMIGQSGEVLSLQEMRRAFIDDIPFEIKSFKDEPMMTDDKLKYYWAKNLYYFSSLEETSYDVETMQGPHNKYVFLLPSNMDPKLIKNNRTDSSDVYTYDEERFWGKPSELKIVP